MGLDRILDNKIEYCIDRDLYSRLVQTLDKITFKYKLLDIIYLFIFTLCSPVDLTNSLV